MRRRFVSVLLILTLVLTLLPVAVLAEEEEYPLFEGTLRISEEGIEMIQDLEGFIAKPWHDVSQYSIGYGCSTAYAEKYGFDTDALTKEEAHQLMLFVLDEMEEKLDAFLEKYDVDVNQYQYDALMSLTYNIGKLWIGNDTRLGGLLVEGGYTVNELASAFGIYCHTGSGENAVVQDHLVSRRIREAKLFLYGAYDFSDVEEKFCRLTYEGNVPPDYSDVALYLQDSPYQVLFEADPTSDEAMEGLFFAGWYTEDGELLTPETVVDDNLTVYARWSDFPVDYALETYAPAYVTDFSCAVTEKTYVNGEVNGSSEPEEEEEEPEPDRIYVEASTVFPDLNAELWYYNYVNVLYNDGVINGYEDSTFRPNNTVTTGEALKMILLAAGYAEPERVQSHWARGYLNLALDEGIIDRGDITDLDVPISRAMMAKVAANALGVERLYDSHAFADTDNVYAAILSDWGITEGYEDGTFRPNRSLTRAEISAIVYRINGLW